MEDDVFPLFKKKWFCNVFEEKQFMLDGGTPEATGRHRVLTMPTCSSYLRNIFIS